MLVTLNRGVIVVREPDPDAAGLLAQGSHHQDHPYQRHHQHHHLVVVVVVNANIIKCALSGIIYPKYSMVGRFCGANIIAREWAFNGLASVIKFFALFKENL